MATQVTAGTPATFDVSYGDTGLFVRMTIFNMATGSPVFVTTVNMVETASPAGTYGANYTFTTGVYLIVQRVYDSTYTTLSPDYSPGSDSLQVIAAAGGSGGGTVAVSIAGVIEQTTLAAAIVL